MLGFPCLAYLGFCPHCSRFYFLPPQPERWKNCKTRRRYRRERKGRHQRYRLAIYGQSKFFVEALQWRLRGSKSNAESDWTGADERQRWFGRQLPVPEWEWEFVYGNHLVWWPFEEGEGPPCPVLRDAQITFWQGQVRVDDKTGNLVVNP